MIYKEQDGKLTSAVISVLQRTVKSYTGTAWRLNCEDPRRRKAV